MLYLGIDVHAGQFTLNLRDENGEMLLCRQVSIAGDESRFLEETARRPATGGYVAILEVCGLHATWRTIDPLIKQGDFGHQPWPESKHHAWPSSVIP